MPPPTDDVSVSVVRRYALRAEIASGSTSTVHLGRLVGPERFERTVAVKRLRPSHARDAECVSSVLDCACLTANIRHPNVVPALDVVTGDEVLVVMEYVHGESLAALLRTERGRGAPTPLAVASGVVVGILRGLDAVHAARALRPAEGDRGAPGARGVLAPQDVLVGTDGIARLIDVAGRPRAGAVPAVGSRAGADDERPAWFGASVVLWEALAGRAFLPRTPEGFEAPSRYREGLDPAVDAVVAKGLASSPASGFRTAGEMARALEAALPPALPSQVGAWVESLAREALDARARLLAKVEDPAGVPAPHAAAPASPFPAPAQGTEGAAPAAATDAAQVVTRRLRSTPPPAHTLRDVPPADSTRAEVTARIRRGALRRRRVAMIAAGIVGPALLVLVCARYGRDDPPAGRSAAPAQTTTSTAPVQDPVEEPAPSPAPRIEATASRHEEPTPQSAARAPKLRPAAAGPAAAPRSLPSRPAAPDPSGAARAQPSPRLTRDDVL